MYFIIFIFSLSTALSSIINVFLAYDSDTADTVILTEYKISELDEERINDIVTIYEPFSDTNVYAFITFTTEVTPTSTGIISTDYKILTEDPHLWTELSHGLVAHGGGGILNVVVSNCYEALTLNYRKGHRVFEMDLNLTSDNELVAVHDWPSYAGIKSLAEFKEIKIADVFTSMDLDDIYAFMQTNKDAYLITDTKSFEYSEEETALQFRLIYKKAFEYGGYDILSRVIPQIYNERTYDVINEIYSFRSIVYTLYATKATSAEVMEFVMDKDEIKVIAMTPERYSNDFLDELNTNSLFANSLTTNSKLIYLHTINDLDEIMYYKQQGVHGFYTDYIIPSQMERQEAGVKSQES